MAPTVASMTSSATSARSRAPQGPQHGVVLGAPIGLGRAPQPGRVDEAHRAVRRVDHRVDGVACRPGHVVDDRALLPEEPVEERRLADVGPSDDGHPRRAVAVARCSVAAAADSAPSSGSGTGRRPTTSSSRSPVPRPCSALTGKGSPSPRETNSHAAASRLTSSTLLTTRRTGGPARRITWPRQGPRR